MAGNRRKHVCGRDPNAGPGSCPFWWETCSQKTPPPSGCFSVWANQHGTDVYAWRDLWVSPVTGEPWPPVPWNHLFQIASSEVSA